MTTNIKSKLTISGTCPTFDEAELKRRQAGYKKMYLQTSQCMEVVRASIPYDFLIQVNEKCQIGYVIAQKQPITTLPLDYSVYLIKPAEQQVADLELIDARIKEEYIIEIEATRALFKEELKEQLLQKAELAEQKKVDDKRAKLLADIEQQIDNTFASLAIPA